MKPESKSHTAVKSLRVAVRKNARPMLKRVSIGEQLLHSASDSLTPEQAAEIAGLEKHSRAMLDGITNPQDALKILSERGFLTVSGKLKKIYRSV